jgi:hypothetical protein
MRRALCIVLGCLAISLAVTPAIAVVIDRDTGFDADDVPPNGRFHPDIRSTTRKVVARDDGSRVLSIVVRFYERDALWPLEIRLDARGDARVDHMASTYVGRATSGGRVTATTARWFAASTTATVSSAACRPAWSHRRSRSAGRCERRRPTAPGASS